MTHWRTMLESDWLTHAHLGGKEYTVEIATVKQGTVVGEGGKKSKKPVVTFRGAKLPLALNATNGTTIERLYGPDVEKWIGRMVTLYTDMTQDKATKKMVPCIRVRPTIPKGKEAASAPPGSTPQPPEDEPSDPPPPDERDAGSDG